MIFITAFPEEEVRRRVLEAGAIGFLSKPFDEELLIEYLEAALRSCNGGVGIIAHPVDGRRLIHGGADFASVASGSPDRFQRTWLASAELVSSRYLC